MEKIGETIMAVQEEITADAALGGCAEVAVLWASVTRYGVGDTLYRVDKARRGKLEKVVVKEVRTITTKRTLAAGKTLYVDTLNSFWNEWDLVPVGIAVGLVEQFLWKQADAAKKLGSC